MKKILYISLFLIISCNSNNDIWEGNAGKLDNRSIYNFQHKNIAFNKLNVYCLRDFLTGEDAGGTWEIVTEPAGSDMQPDLTGDNPCIDWTARPCGQYEINYIVGDDCCRDTAMIRPLKCCLEGSSSCN